MRLILSSNGISNYSKITTYNSLKMNNLANNFGNCALNYNISNK